jgi:hypothetical protein
MHETYRMLGQTHELDLLREAQNRGRANLVGRPVQSEVTARRTGKRRSRSLLQLLLTKPAG